MSHSIVRVPRWPAFVAMLATAGVYLALPKNLSEGPRWLLFAIVVILLIPIVATYRRGRYKATRILTLMANGVITVAMIASLVLLVRGIPLHLQTPRELLGSASALWATNILVFALWYWELDAGGPLMRDQPHALCDSSFLFPQMLSKDEKDSTWKPNFEDYLFLAFNTSTAFSPTDTAVLSRGAKVGTMLQSLISLLIIALLAARAVGVL